MRVNNIVGSENKYHRCISSLLLRQDSTLQIHLRRKFDSLVIYSWVFLIFSRSFEKNSPFLVFLTCLDVFFFNFFFFRVCLSELSSNGGNALFE